MAEEVVQENKAEEKLIDPPNPFGSGAWTETIPDVKGNAGEEGVTPTTETKPNEKPTPTPIEIPKEWLKNEFGVEDPAILKAEREEFKKLKETKPVVEEIKFENDQSKQLHELYRTGKWKEAAKIIEKQERIEALTAMEVNKDTAADIIKLNMQLKYPTLTPAQIDFQYKQEYGIPKEPVQKNDEIDEDFTERHNLWKEQASNIQMKTEIAATMAKPELEAAKVKLVLPEIDKPTAKANEPTAEQLEMQHQMAEKFLAKLESDFTKAEGFTTKVKDESVKLEFPVEFKIPADEKVAIKTRLEKGLDINDYIDKRWFDENNNPKIEQMISDLYQLENLDKILSGIANDSANERLKQHRKLTGNVHVNGNGSHQTFEQSENGGAKPSPFSNDAWSEKPPVLTNN